MPRWLCHGSRSTPPPNSEFHPPHSLHRHYPSRFLPLPSQPLTTHPPRPRYSPLHTTSVRRWEMTLTSLKSEGGGVTKLLVGGFVPSRNGVAFDAVSMNEFYNGVTLSGKSSSDACDSLSLYDCVMAACCTHCAVEYASGNSVSACTSAANADACNGVVTPPGSCLDECNAYDDDRDACMADERCGYCDKTERCLTGKPGTSCEPCEETYVGTDFAQGWPHEGRGVFWAPPPPPPSSPPTSPPPPAAPVCINPVSTCRVRADLTLCPLPTASPQASPAHNT